MRIYKSNPFGYELDLDNSDNFDYLPKNMDELRNIWFKEVGYSYWYMNFLHKDVFDKFGDNQKLKINKYIQDYNDNFMQNFNNILWLQEKIFLLQDNIENMC